MEISIIIVSFNTKILLKNCINSIYSFTRNITFEIIVVDNNSIDGSQEMIKEDFTTVKLIESKVNLGFGKANNLGAKIASGKYLFLLNSDCLLIENTILSFYDYMEINNLDESIGAIGALLYDENLNLNKSYHKFPTIINDFQWNFAYMFNKLFLKGKEPKTRFNYPLKKSNNEVDFIIGADLFISKQCFINFGGFDERFFLFFEETDLQKRMDKNNIKRLILKDQRIIHLESGSSNSKKPSLKIQVLYRESMYKYFKKHYSILSYYLFYILITPLKTTVLFDKNYPLKGRKTYLKVLVRQN